MKKLVTTLLVVAAMSALATTAFAVNLLMEPFTYPNGALVPNGGWVNHGTSTSNFIGIQVLANRATGTTLNAPDDSKAFAAQTATASTYACCEVIITNSTPLSPPKPAYFLHFKDSGTLNFPGRVYVVSAGAGFFTFAISANSTSATTTGVVLWPGTLSYGTRYYLVLKYDAAAGSATLWVNPVSEASANISHTYTNALSFAVSGIALRQGSASTFPAGGPSGAANWEFTVDNLGVGQSFGDACAQVTPTDASSWGRIKTIYR